MDKRERLLLIFDLFKEPIENYIHLSSCHHIRVLLKHYCVFPYLITVSDFFFKFVDLTYTLSLCDIYANLIGICITLKCYLCNELLALKGIGNSIKVKGYFWWKPLSIWFWPREREKSDES